MGSACIAEEGTCSQCSLRAPREVTSDAPGEAGTGRVMLELLRHAGLRPRPVPRSFDFGLGLGIGGGRKKKSAFNFLATMALARKHGALPAPGDQD